MNATPSTRTRTLRPRLHRFAMGGSWFLILASLGSLAWVIGRMMGDPGSAATLIAGPEGPAIGLTYQGTFGTILALGQGAFITVAAILSVLGDRPLRRFGHLSLLAWAGLWTANAVQAAAVYPQIDSVSQASVLAVLFGCTAYRAGRAWRTTPRVPVNQEADRAFFETVAALRPNPTPKPKVKVKDKVKSIFGGLIARLKGIGPGVKSLGRGAVEAAKKFPVVVIVKMDDEDDEDGDKRKKKKKKKKSDDASQPESTIETDVAAECDDEFECMFDDEAMNETFAKGREAAARAVERCREGLGKAAEATAAGCERLAAALRSNGEATDHRS